MTTTTTNYWTTDFHDYLEITPCADPAACTIAAHWKPNHDEHTSLPDAEEYAQHGDDAPAVRIIEVQQVTTTRIVKTIPALPD